MRCRLECSLCLEAISPPQTGTLATAMNLEFQEMKHPNYALILEAISSLRTGTLAMARTAGWAMSRPNPARVLVLMMEMRTQEQHLARLDAVRAHCELCASLET